MTYAGIIENDVSNGEGICLSYWAQGCPHKCKGCHNPQTWDDNAGIEVDENKLLYTITSKLNANNLLRNLSVLGGEPLSPKNSPFTFKLISHVKKEYPSIKIYLWTGYELEELSHSTQMFLFANCNVIVTGRYVEELRKISKWSGSSNQKVLLKNVDF